MYGIIQGVSQEPENIRLQEGDPGRERVRVLDFGIAKHLSQTPEVYRQPVRQPPYTPPERLDRGGVDRHSDLWAVEVVLFMCVAGYSPVKAEPIPRRWRGRATMPLPIASFRP